MLGLVILKRDSSGPDVSSHINDPHLQVLVINHFIEVQGCLQPIQHLLIVVRYVFVYVLVQTILRLEVAKHDIKHFSKLVHFQYPVVNNLYRFLIFNPSVVLLRQ